MLIPHYVGTFAKEVRREQTQREIHRLISDLNEWRDKRAAADGDVHSSQREAIFGDISGAAKALDEHLSSLDLSRSIGECYADCARFDVRTVWLWRVFQFFRDKFDQRDDGNLKPVLQAADEIIWSCYRPFFPSGFQTSPKDPPPLPYIEAKYSPVAVRKDEMPGSLVKQGEFAGLEEFLNSMPIPILQLPPTVVTAPWALVLIGHEVGHFIQPLVLADFGYVKAFKDLIETTVDGASGEEADVRRWGKYARELFADWYSAVAMGPWALWGMAQFEIKDEKSMAADRSKDGYPSPIVRLALLADLIDKHMNSKSGTSMLNALGLDPEASAATNTEIKRDLVFVRALRDAITTAGLTGSLDLLPERLAFRREDYLSQDESGDAGEVEQWSRALQGRQMKIAGKDRRTARLIAAGCARAWSDVMTIEDRTQRNKAMKQVTDAAMKNILASRDTEKRGPGPAVMAGAAGAGRGKHLSERLMGINELNTP